MGKYNVGDEVFVDTSALSSIVIQSHDIPKDENQLATITGKRKQKSLVGESYVYNVSLEDYDISITDLHENKISSS